MAGVVGGKRRRDASVIQVRGERLSIYDMEFGFWPEWDRKRHDWNYILQESLWLLVENRTVWYIAGFSLGRKFLK